MNKTNGPCDSNKKNTEYQDFQPYMKIPNELVNALVKIRINGIQYAILLCIIRYTFGFNRRSHILSISFMAEAIKTHRNVVQRELTRLINLNIVSVYNQATCKSTREIGINTDYSGWHPISCLSTDELGGSQIVATSDNQLVVRSANQLVDQDINKCNKKINKSRIFLNSPEITAEAERLYELYPRKRGKDGAMKKLPKLISELGSEVIENAILRYSREVKGKENDYIQYASTFFNSGYVDYIDTENELSAQISQDPKRLEPLPMDAIECERSVIKCE